MEMLLLGCHEQYRGWAEGSIATELRVGVQLRLTAYMTSRPSTATATSAAHDASNEDQQPEERASEVVAVRLH
jgi:hypothetical protein